MSCDDNVCAECGRVCRDNPPRDWVAQECCMDGKLVCVECCEACPWYGGCEDTEENIQSSNSNARYFCGLAVECHIHELVIVQDDDDNHAQS